MNSLRHFAYYMEKKAAQVSSQKSGQSERDPDIALKVPVWTHKWRSLAVAYLLSVVICCLAEIMSMS